jgi:hypothetical protein
VGFAWDGETENAYEILVRKQPFGRYKHAVDKEVHNIRLMLGRLAERKGGEENCIQIMSNGNFHMKSAELLKSDIKF